VNERFDLFISYSHDDFEAVAPLIGRLREGGFSLWIDEEQIGGGDPLLKGMVEGIRKSDHLIAALSQSYLESKWATFESAVNQTMDPDNRKRRLIPVVVKPCKIPEEYRWLYCPDLTGVKDWEAEYSKVIKNVGKIKEYRGKGDYQSSLESHEQNSLVAYMILVFIAFPGFVFYMCDPTSYLIRTIIFLIVPGSALVLPLLFLRPKVGTRYQRSIFKWCERNSYRLLFLTIALLIGAMVFAVTLRMYPIFFGVYFRTPLEEMPQAATVVLLITMLATAILHLPTAGSLRIQSMWISIRRKTEDGRTLSAMLLVVILLALPVPIDFLFYVTTPRVSFTESREVIEGVIHVEQKSELSPSLNAYTLNEAHIHFLCPQAIVVKEFYVPFQTNSSKGFSIVTSSIGTVRTTLDKDQKVIGLNVSVRPFPEFQSEIVIHYHSELDLSRVLMVSGWNKQQFRWDDILIRDFQNGTRVYRRTLTLTNISKYQVQIDGPFWIYIPSDRFEITLEKEYSDASSLYSQSRQTYYLPSTTISSDGYVRISITYVQG
jgi:hypothetical protein